MSLALAEPQQLELLSLVPERPLRIAVGFTGSRLGMSAEQKRRLRHLLQLHGATEFHHGDCRGADAQAHDIARDLGLWIVGHPPTAEGLRAFCHVDEERIPLPFLARNHMIVRETQLLIAAPSGPPQLRSGTWSTVRYARNRKPFEILPWG